MTKDAGRDVLRVLDEGLVIAGEVQVKLMGLKLLPIKVSLVIASVRRAESLGLKWWPARPGPSRRAGGNDGPGPGAVAAQARNGHRRPRRGRQASS